MTNEGVITSVKFKLYFDNENDRREMDEFFDEYAKAVTFAARIIDKLRKKFKPLGRYVDKRWVPEIGVCSKCNKNGELYRVNTYNGEKLCKSCYNQDFSDTAIRKRIVPVVRGKRKGEKVDGSLNLRNVTTKISQTHMHYAVRDALQILDALKKQRKQRLKRHIRDKKRLKMFEEMLSDPLKRVEVPQRKGQRVVRYVHKSQEDRVNELPGYSLAKIKNKIVILKRNLYRDKKSLFKMNPIYFKGTRVTLTPTIKFDVSNNRVRITLLRARWYGFSGSNVASERGRKYFSEKLQKILALKPRYAYLIRKQIAEVNGMPIYEYYLQYAVEEFPKPILEYTGVLGIDWGIKKLAALVFFEKNDPNKPKFVKFFKADEIIKTKISWRKQRYALTGLHHRIEKMKRMRPIKPKIDYILHNISKEIVNMAKQKNAAIAIEKLEKIKKSKPRQRSREKYFLSLGDYAKLAQFISYKAKKEGIAVIEISPEYTSRVCSHCGSINTERPYKKPNALRPSWSLFKCNDCGVELNSDYNAACNIAKKGLDELTRSL
ncbi:MAG: transposase [Candidatus Hadarchaeales archaeon]